MYVIHLNECGFQTMQLDTRWYPPFSSLQKFKLNIANTVISQDNSSLRSMNTAEILDLFQLSDSAGNGREDSVKVHGTHTIIELDPLIIIIPSTPIHTPPG